MVQMALSLTKIIVSLAFVYLTIKLFKWYLKYRRLVLAVEKLPGPPCPVPLLNHAAVFIYLDTLKYKWGTYALAYHLMSNMHKLYGEEGITRYWIGFKPIIQIFSPENIESVLTSTSVINKAEEYGVFEPWIGEGLLTSKKNKWRFRRKILTPAFHFRILNDFLPTLNEEATTLVKKLNQPKYLRSGTKFDITVPITLCTLDSLCVTAMGVNMNCQLDERSVYAQALYELAEIALERVIRPWLWPDWSFFNTEAGRKFNKAKQVMHDFSTKVILERKVEWEKQLTQNSELRKFKRVRSGRDIASSNLSDATDNTYEEDRVTLDDLRASSFFASGNKRFAFLDLLLYQHLIEKTMSLTDVREEVDTFMFAGHDTTAMSLSWTLYMLGIHEDIQAKAREELDKVFANDLETETFDHDDLDLAHQLRITNLTNEHLRELKYLDRVIKESLRLWPSVPFLARSVTEDIKVGGKYVIPKGSTCVVFMHVLHNNPKYYPKPEVFDPDRFLPENSVGRHPFAYIPFSAGPRNCIGQKFAQMELKIILAKVLRNYYIKSVEPRDKLAISGELVLRARNGLSVQMTPRFKKPGEVKQ